MAEIANEDSGIGEYAVAAGHLRLDGSADSPLRRAATPLDVFKEWLMEQCEAGETVLVVDHHGEPILESSVHQRVDVIGAAKMLRKEMRRESTVLPEGTVLRFRYLGQYTFAALFVAGLWWLTGDATSFGARRFKHRDFVQRVLTCEQVSDIEIAEGWRAV